MDRRLLLWITKLATKRRKSYGRGRTNRHSITRHRSSIENRRFTMKARDIMTPDPEVVTPEQSISCAAQIMRDCDVGVVPVVNNDGRTLIGLITDRDIAVRHVADGHAGDCTVGAHMTCDDIET